MPPKPAFRPKPTPKAAAIPKNHEKSAYVTLVDHHPECLEPKTTEELHATMKNFYKFLRRECKLDNSDTSNEEAPPLSELQLQQACMRFLSSMTTESPSFIKKLLGPDDTLGALICDPRVAVETTARLIEGERINAANMRRAVEKAVDKNRPPFSRVPFLTLALSSLLAKTSPDMKDVGHTLPSLFWSLSGSACTCMICEGNSRAYDKDQFWCVDSADSDPFVICRKCFFASSTTCDRVGVRKDWTSAESNRFSDFWYSRGNERFLQTIGTNVKQAPSTSTRAIDISRLAVGKTDEQLRQAIVYSSSVDRMLPNLELFSMEGLTAAQSCPEWINTREYAAAASNRLSSLHTVVLPREGSRMKTLRIYGTHALRHIVNLQHQLNLTTVDTRMAKGSALVDVDLSHCNKLNTINENAFMSCNHLKRISFPSKSDPSVRTLTIGRGVCEGASNLQSFDLSGYDTVEKVSIGGDFLKGCLQLKEVKFPPKATLVDSTIFSFLADCRALVSIDLSMCSSIAELGHGFLQNCTSLKVVDLSSMERLSTVGKDFLCGLSSLERIVFPTSGLRHLQAIGDRFIADNSSLTTVENLKSDCVSSMSQFPCSKCPKLGPDLDLTGLTSVRSLPRPWRSPTGKLIQGDKFKGIRRILISMHVGFDYGTLEDLADATFMRKVVFQQKEM